MWICNLCQFKNDDSSIKCHGLNCDGVVTNNADQIPKFTGRKTTIDECPKCHEEKTLVAVGRKGLRVLWKCPTCKSKMIRIAPYKPKGVTI